MLWAVHRLWDLGSRVGVISRSRYFAAIFNREKVCPFISVFHFVENFRMFEAGTVQDHSIRQVRKFRTDFFVPIWSILSAQGLLNQARSIPPEE